jgi:hypothetical protein
VLAVKDNQPTLAESIRNFFTRFKEASLSKIPHGFAETIEKDHGRLETRRCYAFDQLNYLAKPKQWPDLKCFVVIDSERTHKDGTARKQRYYLSRIAPKAARIVLPSLTEVWRTDSTGAGT